MPSLVTHQLCALEAMKQCSHPLVVRCITSFPEAFSIGSSGPDFFFFYHVIPVGNRAEASRVSSIGGRMHHEEVNNVFEQALKYTRSTRYHKEETIAYVAGWLCHYALDKHCHPYVFYHTGFKGEQHMNNHRRMEAMIDTLMLKKKKQLTIRQYKPYDVVNRSTNIDEILVRLFAPIVKQTFQESITQAEITQCLKDMRQLYWLLDDPFGLKFKAFSAVEKQPYAFTGTLIKAKPSKDDLQYDVLNENHAIWHHPCDYAKQSSMSFMELYEQSVLYAANLMNYFGHFMEHACDASSLLDIIHNETYDTAMQPCVAMKYYHNIYSEEEYCHEDI